MANEDIIAVGRSNPFLEGAQAIAQGAGAFGAGLRRREEEQKQAAQVEKNQQASQLLRQAFSDETADKAMVDDLVFKAFELSPEMTQKAVDLVNSRDKQAGKFGIEREKLDIRREELEARKLERAIKKETNALKKEELKNKLKLQEQKIVDSEDKKVKSDKNVEASRKSTIDLVDRMLGHSGLDSAVGASSALPTIPGGDSADFEALLETLKGRQFLTEVQKMKGQGSLSDSEGKKIAAAAESISLSMSEGEFKRALNRIKSGLDSAKPAGTYNNQEESTESAGEDQVINWEDL